jgi:hypothetical protein
VTSYRVEDLLELVREGCIRVPSLQSRWRWNDDDLTALFDSLYRGYPVGALLLWKREGQAGTMRLGPHTFPVPARDEALWVVDGRQRITALAGVLIASQRPDRDPAFDLYFDLQRQAFVRPAHHSPPPRDWVPMGVVVDTAEMFAWLDDYRKHHPPLDRVQLATRMADLIRGYEIPACVVDAEQEEVVRHMLQRLSTAGQPRGQADLLDALKGEPERAQPGGLHEVADGLRETGFGDFPADLLLRCLRALRGQDGAGVHLGVSTTSEEREALSRTELALQQAIAFFREYARIPHLRLLPCEAAVVTLAVFFDRHPAPSTRSRQLLARWIWRGAITGAHRDSTLTSPSTLSAIRDHEESAAVDALLRVLPPKPPSMHALERFDLRTAWSRLEVLALLSLAPKNLWTGQRVAVTDLVGPGFGGGLPMLLDAQTSIGPDLEERAASIVNRILHPPIPAQQLQALLAGEVSEEIVTSHGMTLHAWRALQRNHAADFLQERGARLSAHIHQFLEARAAWDQDDRPALSALFVTDD